MQDKYLSFLLQGAPAEEQAGKQGHPRHAQHRC